MQPAAAFAGWKKTPITNAPKILTAAAEYLEANADKFARELTREEASRSRSRRMNSCARADAAFLRGRGQSFSARPFPRMIPTWSCTASASRSVS